MVNRDNISYFAWWEGITLHFQISKSSQPALALILKSKLMLILKLELGYCGPCKTDFTFSNPYKKKTWKYCLPTTQGVYLISTNQCILFSQKRTFWLRDATREYWNIRIFLINVLKPAKLERKSIDGKFIKNGHFVLGLYILLKNFMGQALVDDGFDKTAIST